MSDEKCSRTGVPVEFCTCTSCQKPAEPEGSTVYLTQREIKAETIATAAAVETLGVNDVPLPTGIGREIAWLMRVATHAIAFVDGVAAQPGASPEFNALVRAIESKP